jgi:hypothetical protein
MTELLQYNEEAKILLVTISLYGGHTEFLVDSFFDRTNVRDQGSSPRLRLGYLLRGRREKRLEVGWLTEDHFTNVNEMGDEKARRAGF